MNSIMRIIDARNRLARQYGHGMQGPPGHGVRFDFVKPILGAYTAVNQGGATLTENRQGLTLMAPTQATTSLRIWKKAIPAVPYTLRCSLWPAMYNELTHHCGIGFRESSTGRLHTLSVWNDGTISVSRWTSPTAFSAHDLAPLAFPTYARPYHFTLRDDNVSRYFDLGDGYRNDLNLFSLARATFLTANELFFYANVESLNIASYLTLLSWLEE